MRRWALAAVIALAPLTGAHAQDAGVARVAVADGTAPEVKAEVAAREAHVGDPLTVVVTAVTRRGVPVNLPAQLELGPFALLERHESESTQADGRLRRQFRLQVAAYETGELTLPALGLTYIAPDGSVLTIDTEPVPITIKSLIANEPEPELKPNAPPVSVLQPNRLLIGLLLGLLVAALGALVGVALWRRWRARPQVRATPPPRPPHEVALERLDRLGAAGFLEHADYRPFYFTLSEIVRDYVGARFGFDALELTTEELVVALRARLSSAALMAELEGWLAGCDLVKFAKVSPSAAEARGAFETALRIVSITRPLPERPVSGGAAANAAAEAHNG